MKRSTVLLSIVTCTLALSSLFAKVEITDVSTTNISKSTQNYDLNITLKNIENTITNWALGFYMPRTYMSLGKCNPKLKMTISEVDNSDLKSELKVVVKKNTLVPGFYGEGYINILTPESNNFPLKKGTTYNISLKNNNQWAPGNYVSMPQSFFLATNYSTSTKTPEFIIINPTIAAYNVGGYDESKISTAIDSHLKNIWDQSQELESDSFADKYSLIPSPVSVTETSTTFSFKHDTDLPIINSSTLNVNNTLKIITDYIKKDLNINTEIKTNTKESINYGIIIKNIKKPELIEYNPEGYILSIDDNNITIEALKSAGVFYAFQTLRQLWKENKELPGLMIIDYPRFEYRGLLLDVARHFFSVEEVKKLLDILSINKINTLHIHFSDDEGWRLELKDEALKSLTQIGASRGFVKHSSLIPALLVQANLDITNYENYNPNKPLIVREYTPADILYRGYYTENDIKELIAYANNREITIIPEVDLPGHARALILSLPNILVDPADTSKYISVQGYTDDVIPVYLYNKKSEQGAKFTETMNKIINGVASLFNNQTTYYHNYNEISVGGDEVSADCLQNNPNTPKSWRGKSALEKSQYFFKLLQAGNNNLILSGWQQFVQNDNGTINNNNAIQADKTGHVWVWQVAETGIPSAKTLLKEGYPTVLAFADKTYFDLIYNPSKWEPGFSWSGHFIDTNAALNIASATKKVISGLSKAGISNIKGLEGTLWSENIPTFRHLTYMGLPKMAGLAEAAWTPEKITVQSKTIGDKTIDAVNWKSLSKRLGNGKTGFLKYLHDTCNIEYRKYPYGIEPLTYPKYNLKK